MRIKTKPAEAGQGHTKGVIHILYNEAIREARLNANLTQEQVAEALHISRVMIARYELGTGSAPSISRLIELANLYNVSVDKLIGRE